MSLVVRTGRCASFILNAPCAANLYPDRFRAGELAEAEFHHPDISFGWGYATVSLRTKKIKGLHENDFIMAAKLDRLAGKIAAADKQVER